MENIEISTIGNSLFVKKNGTNNNTAQFPDWQDYIGEETGTDETFEATVIDNKRWESQDFWEIIFNQPPTDTEINIVSRCVTRLFNSLA